MRLTELEARAAELAAKLSAVEQECAEVRADLEYWRARAENFRRRADEQDESERSAAAWYFGPDRRLMPVRFRGEWMASDPTDPEAFDSSPKGQYARQARALIPLGERHGKHRFGRDEPESEGLEVKLLRLQSGRRSPYAGNLGGS